MKKKNLKVGNIVENREGVLWLYNYVKGEATFICLNDSGFNPLMYYEEDLKNTTFKNLDIMKVYEDYTLQKLLWEREEIKLTEEEKEVLKALKVLGLERIARDESKALFAYQGNIKKSTTKWCLFVGQIIGIKKEMFSFIKWEDEEPYLIEDLLKEVNNNDCND